MAKVGVYVCHCGINISATVDVEAVREFAATLPHVTVARDYQYMCSDPGQALIKEDIQSQGLDRVVVAACSPRMHELTFRATIQEAGENPYHLEVANIREQVSWVHHDQAAGTEKAKQLIAAAVNKAVLLEALAEREVAVTPAAMVIGGGIAGLSAALDIADAGFKTYLIEREPGIGGRMAQLHTTFPDGDDAGEMLAGVMARVDEHPDIVLLTNTQVDEVSGYVGNFEATVTQRPRYVNADRCTACGACAPACVLAGQIPDPHNLGLSRRGAIYQPFPGAAPSTYVVDAGHCLYVRDGACGDAPACALACPEEAVDFGQKPVTARLNVGAIVVATGYDLFDPRLEPELAYGIYPNVITGLEFERLADPDGPTGGAVRINGHAPQDVVFIQCVGSRYKEHLSYCSRICCMYTAKQAHLVRQALPEANVTVFYMDVRAFGKGFEEYYDQVRAEGVHYCRGNPSEIYHDRKSGKLIVRAEDTLIGQAVAVPADLVVLATGVKAREDANEIAGLLKLARSADGFFAEAHPKLRPVDTTSDGVFLAGTCQAPKDIPDTISQAKAAASSALIPLSRGTVQIEAITSIVDEELCAGCRLCEHQCPYGALAIHPWKHVMTVNAALCKGCGACSMACPSGAIQLQHFTADQTLAMIEALLA
ncbi:MAG: 4Fe-4S binding protein [Chloroflexota bacterium]